MMLNDVPKRSLFFGFYYIRCAILSAQSPGDVPRVLQVLLRHRQARDAALEVPSWTLLVEEVS